MWRLTLSVSRGGVFFLVILTSAIAGCGGSKVADGGPTIESNLQALYVFHGQFTGQNRGRSPKDEAEFKSFLRKLPPDTLSMMKIDNVDALFTSPRDNEPIVIRYNLPPAIPGAPDAGVLAHEAKGNGGERVVLLASGQIMEMDESQFSEASSKK